LKKFSLNKIYNQNCIDGMKDIPDNKIDLVITDPHLLLTSNLKKQITIELLHEFYLDIMKLNLRIITILPIIG